MFRKFKKIIIPVICLVVIGVGLTFYPVLAQTEATPPGDGTECIPPQGGTECIPPKTGPTALQNPLGDINTPTQLIGKVIFAILGLTGAIALAMFIWGGLQWMTAAGNAEKVTKGRDTLMWAVLGLVIIFSSYAILKAVLGILE